MNSNNNNKKLLFCRAALMTGVYPFRMGLQRGFGKRSPQECHLLRSL